MHDRSLTRLVVAAVVLSAAVGRAETATDFRLGAGDPGFDLRTWRSEDGLPSDAVIAIEQTPDGYLWVGTNGGLARFDGVRFTVFDRRSTPELQSDQCGPLYVDPAGVLWIGTMGGGLTRYAGGKFAAFGRAQGATFEYIISMVPDSRGKIWLGTNDRLHLWDGARFTPFGPENGLTIGRPFPLAEDDQGHVWIEGVHGEFAWFDGARFHASRAEGEIFPSGFPQPVRPVRGADKSWWLIGSTPPKLSHWSQGVETPIPIEARSLRDGIGRVVAGRRDEVWVGMRESGLRVIRGDRVSMVGADDGLPAGPITALYVDREGNVWVGTSGGLTRIKPRSFTWLAPADGLELERTWAAFEDSHGALWFGTDGIAWRLSGGLLHRFGIPEGLPAIGVTSFAEDRDGNVWIGGSGGLCRVAGSRLIAIRKADGLPTDNVRALYVDREGRLWIGTSSGLAVMERGRLKTYTTADGLAGDWVRFIHEDARGDLWLATTSGLSRLRDGAFTSFGIKDGLADDRVLAIHETPDGALWLGTYRGGVCRYKDGRFATISRAAGLYDDTVLRILEDDAGAFWISSPHGIFRVGRKEMDDVADGRARAVNSVSYDKTDGLPTIDCGGGTQPAGWKGRDGRMWFPTGRGVVMLDPSRAHVNPVPPAVRIEEVFYDRVHPGGPVEAALPAGSKTVEIHYTATLLGAPDRVRFRYRLEPFDSDWVEAAGRRVAYFTALRPGRYRFRVTAANESGLWSPEGAVYDLRVAPFFYETPSFALVLLLAVVLLGWGAYRLRVRQLEARYAAVLSERGRIARELHDTIAQGFTGVSMQLEAAQAKLDAAPAAARENIDRARSLVRTSLTDARRSVRALRPHLLESGDLAESLRAVAAQLTAGTSVRATVRSDGIRKRLPLAIEDALFRVGQEAMTNALRHGGCRTIVVALSGAKGQATLTIDDDGAGFDEATVSGGSGLAGMRERVGRLGGTISVASRPGEGTRVVASVPVRRGFSEGPA